MERTRPRWIAPALILVLVLLAMPGAQARAAEAPANRVAASILPQAYFLERIGGDRVAVEVLVGPGQSPGTYEPSPRQLARLSEARLYFRIGVPFEESLVPRLEALYPEMKVVDTARGLPLRRLEESDPAHSEHGHCDHDHGELDPHTWLSPRLALVQSEVMARALSEQDPEGIGLYREGLKALRADLTELDERLRTILAPLEGRTLLVFHPAFGYLAGEYGLRQVAIETGGRSPGPRHLRELIHRARAEKAGAVFVQPQFSTRAAEAVAAEIGVPVVPIDPLARDYIANLEAMAGAIREALGGNPPR